MHTQLGRDGRRRSIPFRKRERERASRAWEYELIGMDSERIA